MRDKPVVLLIFDGWGISREREGNAIVLAEPKVYNGLIDRYPNIAMEVSGRVVGLPPGQMGNSEVGHLNMGAGRVVDQEITRIDKAIEDGTFFQNPELLNDMTHVKNQDSTLHVMGLMSHGGVHSSLLHLRAILDMAKQQGVQKLRVHGFLDGRDVGQKSAWEYVEPIEQRLLDLGYPQITTLIGRYYAMDRDKRWERTEQAYNMLVSGEGTRYFFSEVAIQKSYQNDKTDEFIEASVNDLDYEGMQDNDAVIFFNFRPDRARQIAHALTDPNFTHFDRKKVIQNLHFTCLTEYDKALPLPVAFSKREIRSPLAEVLSQQGIMQFHAAETEKYAHVTYFFNGGIEQPFAGEDRCLIPSPHVATYDLQPEMNLPQLTDTLINAINSGKYQFLVCNFANPDMVGHTGNLDAAIDAVRSVDVALARVSDAVLSHDGVLFITADHGNLEKMRDEHGNPHTAHTTNPVPFMAISNHKELQLGSSPDFTLANIAPTILDLMHLTQPADMTAHSMLAGKPSYLPV